MSQLSRGGSTRGGRGRGGGSRSRSRRRSYALLLQRFHSRHVNVAVIIVINL